MKQFPFVFVAALASALVSLSGTCRAFSPGAILLLGSLPRSPRGASTRLCSAADKDRIKKAGAGITTQMPGDLCFYDPNENGRLQGSNTLMDRIENGASYKLTGSQQTPPSSPTPDASATAKPAVETKSIPKLLTTNLSKLLNGEMEGRFGGRGRSQY
ncbi:hypothetical protein ACHAWF_001412 [Thalassiosira exigua]